MSVLLGGNVQFFVKGYTPQKVGHPGSRKSLHHELRRRRSNPLGFWNHMYYSLSSLKGSIEEIIWEYYRVIQVDTRSLDCSPYPEP